MVNINNRDYSTLDFIEDLHKELRTHSEILAQIFPDRIQSFSDRYLSRFWRGNNFRYIARVKNKITNPNNKDYNPDLWTQRLISVSLSKD